MKRHALVILLAMLPGTAAAMCPVGTYLWTDHLGNRVCKRLDSAQPGQEPGGAAGCPEGTSLWLDEWGKKKCVKHGGTPQIQGGPRICPAGTYLWIDPSGRQACKSL